MRTIIIFCVTSLFFINTKANPSYIDLDLDGKFVLVFTKKKIKDKRKLAYKQSYMQIDVFSTKKDGEYVKKIRGKTNYNLTQLESTKGFHLVINLPFNKYNEYEKNKITAIKKRLKRKGVDITYKEEYEHIDNIKDSSKVTKKGIDESKLNKKIEMVTPGGYSILEGNVFPSPPSPDKPQDINSSYMPLPSDNIWSKSKYFKIQLFATNKLIDQYVKTKIENSIEIEIELEYNPKSSRFPYRYISKEFYDSKDEIGKKIRKIRDKKTFKTAYIICYDSGKKRLSK